MKKSQLGEFKTKNSQDLIKKINELKSEIQVGKIELKMGKTKNVHLLSEKKKDLARLKTILKLKEFQGRENATV